MCDAEPFSWENYLMLTPLVQILGLDVLKINKDNICSHHMHNSTCKNAYLLYKMDRNRLFHQYHSDIGTERHSFHKINGAPSPVVRPLVEQFISNR